MFAQRAATGKAETMASAGRVGEMGAPRWMRAIKRLPGRPLKRWWKRELAVLAQCAQEKTIRLSRLSEKGVSAGAMVFGHDRYNTSSICR
jgi:hypothetical protein